MFGTRRTPAKQPVYDGSRSVPCQHSHLGSFRSPDAGTGRLSDDDRVQVSYYCLATHCVQAPVLFPQRKASPILALQQALLAANRDREASQTALTEAKVRQEETAEVNSTAR